MSRAAEKRGGIPAMLKDTAFVWEDPLDLEGELSEEERMVRNSARGFAQSYLMPRVVEAQPALPARGRLQGDEQPLAVAHGAKLHALRPAVEEAALGLHHRVEQQRA